MRRHLARSLLILFSSLVALVGVGLVGVAWSDRANDVCREQAPASPTGYSVTWEWSEAAYVCNYRAPKAETKRVGIIDAFHGEERRRHRP
jgi:hypothetical protein